MGKRRRQLTSEELEEARALKAIFDRRPKPQLSQEKFASEYGLGQTQGIVWQYLNGVIPLNLGAALKFAKALGCEVGDFSPRLAELRASIAGGLALLPYDVPQDEADQLLAYYELLGKPQRQALLAKLHEVVESSGDTLRNRLEELSATKPR